MRRTPAGSVARVKGAPSAVAYFTVDLGRDRRGRLVLTYQRCDSSRCRAIRDDLHGRRVSFRHLTRKRCSLTTSPAVWRTPLAYGLACRTPSKQVDDKRSGLYVKNGASRPRRLRLPSPPSVAVSDISAVDLRGTRVAAVLADVYEYAFTESVGNSRGPNTGLRSIQVAASEGDSDQHSTGVSLGRRGVMWTLIKAEHSGDPNQAVIFRLAGGCAQHEALVQPPGPDQQAGFPASDLAVDGSTLYLVIPGSGIVRHTFASVDACGP